MPFPEQYTKQFDEQFTSQSVKPRVDFSIFVSYFLKSTVELNVPKFKLIAKDGHAQFLWKGMETDLNLSSSKDQIDGHLVIDGITFSKDDTEVNLEKMTTEYDLHQTLSGLYLGEATFNLPSFIVTNNKTPMVHIKDLSMSSSSDIEDKLFSTDFNLGVKSILVNKKIYGPGEVEMSLRNLDADVLAQINQQASTMQNGSEAERQQAVMSMLPELPKLFSKGAEFEISKCNFKIPEGSVDGSLLVSFPKGDTSNPFELLQKIQGHSKIKAPKSLVKQLITQSIVQQMAKQPDLQQALIKQMQSTNNTSSPKIQVSDEKLAAIQADNQINAMIQKSLIVSSGSDYEVELSLTKGNLTVNGKPFDSSMLQF
jgi:uncharacterized protein YdgA (DUF945 family)